MRKKSLYVVGVMSGTSFDGVDCVLCKINSDLSFSLIGSKMFDYPFSIKKEISEIIYGHSNISKLCSINFVLGNFYADCIINFCKSIDFELKKVDLISSHGQTVYHNPTKEKLDGYSKSSTLQIGELSCIAKKTGIITVGDFRPCDMALGGQGAPLVPFFDKILFKNLKKNVVIQNLGGIANATIMGRNKEFLAFDNAPANALIDLAMTKFYNMPFDKDGEIASSFAYDRELLEYIYSIDDFVKLPPPKSTGKEYYNEEFLDKIIKYKSLDEKNIISTITAYTAFAIKKSIDFFSPVEIEEIILSGGGVKNSAMVHYIKHFSQLKVSTQEEYGISSDFKEAIAFAILGYQRFYEEPNNEYLITGASRQTPMGKIVLP